MSGGKGGSTSSSGSSYSSGTSTTELPDWVTSASQQALASGQALANRAYIPYTGQLIASTPSDTLQAYQQIRNMQGMTDPAYNAATNAWSGVLGNLQSLTPEQQNAYTNSLFGNYEQSVINPASSYLKSAYSNAQGLYGSALGQESSLLNPYISAGGPVTAQTVGQNAAQLMSPYTSLVIGPTRALGQQALAQNLEQVGAGANQAGAFGGSRQGVMEGVAQSQNALQESQYLGNLLNQQWNTSLTPAYNMAALNSQQGLSAASTLGAMGYNAANALGQMGQTDATTLAGLLSSGYGQSATQAASIASQNLGLGTSAAQQIPALATSQAAEAAKEAGLLESAGTAEQQQAQNQLSADYAQWYEQAYQYPYQQQETLLGTLDAIPYGSTTNYSGYNMSQGTTQNNPSIGSMITGGIGAVGSLLGIGKSLFGSTG